MINWEEELTIELHKKILMECIWMYAQQRLSRNVKQ